MSRLYLSNPCAFFHYPLHTVLRAQSAPGFPCALCQREGQRDCKAQAKTRRENELPCFHVIASDLSAVAQRAKAEAKQSTYPGRDRLIASAFAPGASADSKSGVACAASVDGSSLSLLAMTDLDRAGERRHFCIPFGIMALSLSSSRMFIFMPPGITMSPGFWSALQAPSHFASIVVVPPAGPRSLRTVDFTV